MTKNLTKTILVVMLAIILLVIIFRLFIIVNPGERAVIFNKLTRNFYVYKKVGVKLLIPLMQQPTIYDIRSRTYTMSIAPLEGELKGDDSLQALTSDGQNVFIDISVRFHPDPNRLDRLHSEIGPEYMNKILRPLVRSVVRIVVSGYPIVDVYSSKRYTIQEAIYREMKEKLLSSYIILDDVLLRNVQFSQEFQKAIENKQIAQQEAQRMKYVLEKQELEKKRQIIEAEGDAEAIRLRGKALQENPSLIQYEYVKLIAPHIQAIVTDQNSILNFSDLLKNPKK